MDQVSKQKFIRELYKRNTPDLINKLKDHNIGIAGCGGLGSNIAVMLVRAGISNIVLVDYDKVDLPNLNRQHFFLDDVGKNKTEALSSILKKINPYINIKIINQKLIQKDIAKVFYDCSIIIEAFDTVEAKSMILEAFSDKKLSSKYLIGASGLAGIGTANSIQTKQMGHNIFICGDFITGADDSIGLMSPRVMITAGHQANMSLRIISKINKP
jgi:sulfur carrier protein ThiS adenylyltransferase